VPPSIRNSWPHFAFLIVTVIVMYFAKWPILLIAGIDLYMGIGGAPEGVLAAAALRCIGGQMQARLVLDRPEQNADRVTVGAR
jgi:fructose-1,6-bisphosphatase glpX